MFPALTVFTIQLGLVFDSMAVLRWIRLKFSTFLCTCVLKSQFKKLKTEIYTYLDAKCINWWHCRQNRVHNDVKSNFWLKISSNFGRLSGPKSTKQLELSNDQTKNIPKLAKYFDSSTAGAELLMMWNLARNWWVMNMNVDPCMTILNFFGIACAKNNK